jgi:hypothetical protein
MNGFDPRAFFPAQEAAYALPVSGMAPGLVDTLFGDDIDGPMPYGALVTQPDGSLTLAIAGTRDAAEWILDFDFFSIDTPLGAMARGIWQTAKSWRWVSGKPLNAYSIARIEGHSRGAPLAITLSAMLSIPAILYACPKLVGPDVLAKAQIAAAYWVDGDIVPLAAPVYPDIPNTVRLSAPSNIPLLSIRDHHIFATYEAAINDTFST